MDISFADVNDPDFDARTYLKVLIAITKSDRGNGKPEIDFVRRQAERLALDFERFWQTTGRDYQIGRRPVSRLTALVIVKDSIRLATMDGNFTLGEKEKVYTYAEKLDLPRRDVDQVDRLLAEFRALNHRWEKLFSGDPE